ncbi:AI-2E family transporter [Flavobacterium sp. FBOR7N2.3]|uniref:AI-2E family transporter n=1 Tax=Flavobacterium magnesitis TaxID=3138077 RepID=A0ABV4TP14_9FLAO
MDQIIKPNIIRQLFVLLLILLMGGLIFREMLPYFLGVLGAITLYVLLKGSMKKLEKRGWRPSLAAAFLMFMSFISILIPIAGALLMLGNKIGQATKNSERFIKVVKSNLKSWEQSLGFSITDQIDASSISSRIANSVSDILGGTLNTFIAVSIMYFFLYYMLINQKQLRKVLIEYIPMKNENIETLGVKINEMVRSNSLGIPLVAIAQGIVALIGFLIFGVESPFFWAVVVTIGSMLPFIGNFLGTIPVFILALSDGNTFQAWGVLIYGIVVVGTTDNIIRLYVLKKMDNVHPLITLLGVIIGIPLFGFLGLVFGPLLLSLFLLVVRIYKQEFVKE